VQNNNNAKTIVESQLRQNKCKTATTSEAKNYWQTVHEAKPCQTTTKTKSVFSNKHIE